MTEPKTITQEIEELITRVQENHSVLITEINVNAVKSWSSRGVEYLVDRINFTAETTTSNGE